MQTATPFHLLTFLSLVLSGGLSDRLRTSLTSIALQRTRNITNRFPLAQSLVLHEDFHALWIMFRTHEAPLLEVHEDFLALLDHPACAEAPLLEVHAKAGS